MEATKNKILKVFLAITLLGGIFTSSKPALGADFNQDLIISDYNFSNSSSLNKDQIEAFLQSENSYFANYTIPSTVEGVRFPYKDDNGSNAWGTVNVPQDVYYADGTFIENLGGKKVSEVLAQYSTELANFYGTGVSPQVILSLMQRESSAINNSAADGSVFKQTTLNLYWPLYYCYNETMHDFGYNYTDARNRALNYGGVGLQIVYAMRNLKKMFSQSSLSPISAGKDYYGDQSQTTIYPQSKATRLLYVYTPWVRPGQLNFFNFYSQNFGDPTSTSTPLIPTSNDIGDYNADIYMTDNFKLLGGKIYSHRAYIGETLIANNDTTTWEVNFAPAFGLNERILVYKDADGNEVGRKTIHVTCHKAADISGDNIIDSTDLSIFASFWGQTNPSNALADLNGDKVVNSVDLSIFASNWGK